MYLFLNKVHLKGTVIEKETTTQQRCYLTKKKQVKIAKA